jgi:hypothetical protein
MSIAVEGSDGRKKGRREMYKGRALHGRLRNAAETVSHDVIFTERSSILRSSVLS